MMLLLVGSFSVAFQIAYSQCDETYTGYAINHIAARTAESDVTYLGRAADSTDCKKKCQNINYLCGKSASNVPFLWNDGMEATFVFSSDACTLSIDNEAGADYGSWVLTTPDFDAAEYIIDLNFEFLSGTEAGIVWTASQSWSTMNWVVVNLPEQKLSIGYMTASGWGNYDLIDIIGNVVVSPGTACTLSIHKQASGSWWIYLNGWLQWQSPSSDAISDYEYPFHYAGVYSWDGDIIAHDLKVTFPNADEAEDVCAGYVYNKATTQCYGYFGTEYDALFESVSENVNYVSGVISPEPFVCGDIAVSRSTTSAPDSTSASDGSRPDGVQDNDNNSQNSNAANAAESSDISTVLLVAYVLLGLAVLCCFVGAAVTIRWLCRKRRERSTTLEMQEENGEEPGSPNIHPVPKPLQQQPPIVQQPYLPQNVYAYGPYNYHNAGRFPPPHVYPPPMYNGYNQYNQPNPNVSGVPPPPPPAIQPVYKRNDTEELYGSMYNRTNAFMYEKKKGKLENWKRKIGKLESWKTGNVSTLLVF